MIATLTTAAQRRRDAEHNERVWLAFNTAAFHRARRLSQQDMQRLLIPRERAPQTPEQMRDIARMITIAYGGSVA